MLSNPRAYNWNRCDLCGCATWSSVLELKRKILTWISLVKMLYDNHLTFYDLTIEKGVVKKVLTAS